MVRRFLILGVIAVGLFKSHEATADGYYVKAYGGLSSLADSEVTLTPGVTDTGVDFASGTIAGGAFGFNYRDSAWASEVEWTYRTGDSEAGATAGGDFASTSLMLNGVYNFESSFRLKPYVGAGLGYVTEIDFDVPGIGEFSDSGGIAFQLFGGVAYAVAERVSAFGEVRYFDAGSVSLSGSGGASLEADYSTVDFLAGITIGF